MPPKNKPVCALALVDTFELYVSCNKSVFKCSLKRDGIGLVTNQIDHVIDVQCKVVGLCVLNGIIFIATSDLVYSHDLESGALHSTDFRARALCSFKGDLLFTDRDWNNVRLFSPTIDCTEYITKRDTSDSRSCTSGLAKSCSFGKAMGLTVEFDANIFVTDSRAGAVKILTTVCATKKFLKNLNDLISSAGVHLRNEVQPAMSIRDSLALVQGVHRYLVSNEERIRLLTNSKSTALNGPQGNVAHKTVNSVKLLADAHSSLIKKVSSINPNYISNINVNTLTTDHIECLHSTSHRKRCVPTVLEHNRDMGSTIREYTKKTAGAGFYYHTHERKKDHYIPPTHNGDVSSLKTLNSPLSKKPSYPEKVKNAWLSGPKNLVSL